jgi:hypothetical protein
MTHIAPKFSRRRLLQLTGTGVATGLVATFMPFSSAQGDPDGLTSVAPEDRKLLFVFCAYGGASIIDSFLPIVEDEVGDPALASTLNTFPSALVEQRPGSNIRSVKRLDSYSYYSKPATEMGELVGRHGQDMVVLAHEVSSVNHTVGQQRSLNGGGFDRGRTIMESVALRHGGGLPLPSCNMASDGYLRHGADPTIPQAARHELITQPLVFAAGTHGYRGLAGAPSAAAIQRARAVRDELDRNSIFGQTFKHDLRLGRYLASRRDTLPAIENNNLIEKLLLLDPATLDPKYGLTQDPLAANLRSVLPRMDHDRGEAQIALAFLMAYHGVSTSISLGFNTEPVIDPNGQIVGSPIAFDFSHNLHRIVQSLMWCRTAALVDKLVMMLKQHDYMGNPALGKMWDRSLVYIATEFGRDKIRPAGSGSWGTGHHLNNGSVLLSPLLKGNAVYGGVDPRTGLTYGFDPVTGAPEKNRIMNESDVYSVIAQALGVPVPGATAFPAVVRNS